MTFDLLIPPQGRRGRGQKSFVARPIYMSNSHIKFGSIYSNGLRGDSLIDRQTDGIKFLTPESNPWGMTHIKFSGFCPMV